MKKKYMLSLALCSANGNVASIPLRTFDELRDAENASKSLQSEIGTLLKEGIIAVKGRNGDAQVVMPLNDFLVNYFRATGMRPVIGEMLHDDGAPEIIIPKPSGLIVPG